MLSTHANFQQQFMLKMDEYRDNNNFLRLNKVNHTFERWSLMGNDEHLRFIDVVSNMFWVGPSKS